MDNSNSLSGCLLYTLGVIVLSFLASSSSTSWIVYVALGIFFLCFFVMLVKERIKDKSASTKSKVISICIITLLFGYAEYFMISTAIKEFCSSYELKLSKESFRTSSVYMTIDTFVYNERGEGYTIDTIWNEIWARYDYELVYNMKEVVEIDTIYHSHKYCSYCKHKNYVDVRVYSSSFLESIPAKNRCRKCFDCELLNEKKKHIDNNESAY